VRGVVRGAENREEMLGLMGLPPDFPVPEKKDGNGAALKFQSLYRGHCSRLGKLPHNAILLMADGDEVKRFEEALEDDAEEAFEEFIASEEVRNGEFECVELVHVEFGRGDNVWRDCQTLQCYYHDEHDDSSTSRLTETSEDDDSSTGEGESPSTQNTPSSVLRRVLRLQSWIRGWSVRRARGTPEDYGLALSALLEEDQENRNFWCVSCEQEEREDYSEQFPDTEVGEEMARLNFSRLGSSRGPRTVELHHYQDGARVSRELYVEGSSAPPPPPPPTTGSIASRTGSRHRRD
jgi:hypothetical protein